jgi:uncharacterized protein YecT (DUF1311 family)
MIGYAQVTANCKGNTVEISNCLDDELAKTEVVLNGLYGRVMRELSKPDQSLMTYSNIKKKVIDAQRAWVLERVMGIEPTLFAWEAKVLPLNYTRLENHYR